MLSQKSNLGERAKVLVEPVIKVSMANEVESYAGTKILKKAFEKTLSCEKTNAGIIVHADLTNLDPGFEHSSVDCELRLKIVDQED